MKKIILLTALVFGFNSFACISPTVKVGKNLELGYNTTAEVKRFPRGAVHTITYRNTELLEQKKVLKSGAYSVKVLEFSHGEYGNKPSVTKYEITKKAKGQEPEVKTISLYHIDGTRDIVEYETSEIDKIADGAKLGCGSEE